MPLRVSPPVTASRELQAVVLAMKAMDRGLRGDINRMTRATFGPVWKGELERRATTRQQRAVLVKGARVQAANPPVAIAASSRRPLRGGLRPGEDPWPFEVGSKNRDRLTTVTRRTTTGTTTYRRRAGRQLAPYQRSGRVVLPALREVAPRIVSGWTQLVIRQIYDAFRKAS